MIRLYQSIRKTRQIGLVASLLLISILLPALATGCSTTKIVEKGNIMVPTTKVPPLDASAPPNIETATFALG